MLRVLGLSSTLIAGLAKAAFAVPSAATPAAAAGPEDPPEESSEAGGGAGAGAGAGAPSDNPDDSGSGDTPGAAVASSGGAEDSGAAADAAAAAEIITARQRIALDLLSNLTELAFKPSVRGAHSAACGVRASRSGSLTAALGVCVQLVLPATSMMMAGMPPRQIPNTLASVAGLIYTRLLREMSLMCDWLCHTNMRYHSVYGTAHEPTRGTARMANTPKSPYEPAKRASQDAADSVRYSGYSYVHHGWVHHGWLGAVAHRVADGVAVVAQCPRAVRVCSPGCGSVDRHHDRSRCQEHARRPDAGCLEGPDSVVLGVPPQQPVPHRLHQDLGSCGDELPPKPAGTW